MQAISLLDASGQLLSSRGYIRNDFHSSFHEKINLPSELLQMIASRSRYNTDPIILHDTESDLSYFTIVRDGLCIVGTRAPAENFGDVVVFMVLEVLYDILRRYYGSPLTESIVKSNFNTLYPILDEFLEAGYPFCLELGSLESTVVPPSLSGLVDKIASAVSSPPAVNSLTGVSPEIWWRRSGVFHSTNELYVDVIESVNCTVLANGRQVSGSVTGKLRVNSRLSALPDCLLTLKTAKPLTEPGVIGFHPCVRVARWKRDHKLSFTPPDGEFILAEYTIRDKSKVVLPFHLNTAVQFDSSRGNITVHVSPKLNVLETNISPQASPKSNKPPQSRQIDDLVIKVKLPRCVGMATLISQAGSVTFDAPSGLVIWSVGSLRVESGAGLKMEGTLLYAPGKDAAALAREYKCAASAEFLVRGWNPSGVRIETVDINGVDYTPYKGCRYSARGGQIDLRI
jgi:AP-3 complex subunit mu